MDADIGLAITLISTIVIVCGFFWKLNTKLDNLDNRLQSLGSLFETLTKTVVEGRKDDAAEHKALMQEFRDGNSSLHEHMRSDNKEHMNEHKELGKALTKTLAYHEANQGSSGK